MDQHAIARAAQLLHHATRIAALTGAGISRPSGIPDFRSDLGLWRADDPMEIASLRGFRADPQRFFHVYDQRLHPDVRFLFSSQIRTDL